MRSRSIEALLAAGALTLSTGCQLPTWYPSWAPGGKPTPAEIFAKALKPDKTETKANKELTDDELVDLAKQIGNSLNALETADVVKFVEQYQAGGGTRLGDLSGVAERAKALQEGKLHLDYEGMTFDASRRTVVFQRKLDGLNIEVAVSDTVTVAAYQVFGRDVQTRSLGEGIDRDDLLKQLLRGNLEDAAKAFERPELEPREMDAKIYLEGLLKRDWSYDTTKAALTSGDMTLQATKTSGVTKYKFKTPQGSSYFTFKGSGREGVIEETVHDTDGNVVLTRSFHVTDRYATQTRQILDNTWKQYAPAGTGPDASGERSAPAGEGTTTRPAATGGTGSGDKPATRPADASGTGSGSSPGDSGGAGSGD